MFFGVTVFALKTQPQPTVFQFERLISMSQQGYDCFSKRQYGLKYWNFFWEDFEHRPKLFSSNIIINIHIRDNAKWIMACKQH